MSQLPIILTAFVNPLDQNYFAYVEKEQDKLQQVFGSLPYLNHIALHGKTEQVFSALTLYQKELLIFHSDGLHLSLKNQDKISELYESLRLCPQLKLAFLSGCNTQEPVIQYLKAGVPAVIVITCSVAEGQSKQFSDTFYSALTIGHTLQEAFIYARNAMKLPSPFNSFEEIVVLQGSGFQENQLLETSCGLYVQKDELLSWQLLASSNMDQASKNSMQLNGESIIALQDIRNSEININLHTKSFGVVEESKNRPNNTLDFGISIAHFVGREQYLADLYTGFKEQNLHVQILRGMLGMGKSRIVFEYVNTWQESSIYIDFIWWIDARNGRDFIEMQLLSLFDRLQPHAINAPPREKKERLFQWMRTHSKSWLLIYVNAPAPETLLGLIPDGEGHVIVTSENPAWEGIFPRTRIQEVLPLDEDHSMQLLKIRSGGKIDEKSAKNLIANLGGYPFLLEQFAALYAENLLDSKQVELYAESLAPGASKDLENRRNVLLNLLISVVGLGEHKTKLDVGTKEVLYFLRIMSHRKIPKDFVINYGSHLVDEFVDQTKPFWRFFLGPLFRWAKRRRAKFTAQKLALLNRLARHSLIWIDDQGLINMHILVHDSFNSELAITMNSRLEKIVMAGNCVEYAFDQFQIRSKKTETIEFCKLLLPHMIVCSDYYYKRFGDVFYLDKLYEKIGDFFENEQKFSTALHYASQALKIQSSRKKAPNKSLVQQCLFLALISGQIKIYDQLWSEFGSKYQFEEHIPIAQEALKQYWLMNTEKAAELMEIALEKANHLVDDKELQAISMLIASLNAWKGSAQAEAALTDEEEYILNTYGENSNEYVGFLLIKAEARVNHASTTDDNEDMILEANDLLGKARQILETTEQISSLLYWQTLILQLDCERILSNPYAAQELMSLIDANYEQIEFLFGSQHLSLASIKFNQAYLHQIDGDKKACVQKLEDAIAINRGIFVDYPNHPIILRMEKVLEDINTMQE